MDSLHSTSPSPESITKHQPGQIPPPKSPEAVSQSGDFRPSRPGARPSEPEHLPCPRCDSTNTKFCYYNNYNLSQPRHFCKSCRRYWTRGGALRNVPIGGGTRKSGAPSSSKRPRRIATTTTDNNDNGATATAQVLDPVAPNLDPGSVDGGTVNLNEAKSGSTLSCWWSSGLLPLNSYGLGSGLGYDHGILNWPMEAVGTGGNGGSAVVPGESSGCSTWQMDGGADSGVASAAAEGDYFCWPELAMSTPAEALK